MKYGVLFAAAAILLAILACTRQGWYWWTLWPSLSLAIVSSGYFFFGPRVYGKASHGLLSPLRQVLLAPYLLYAWGAWRAIRLVSREPAFHRVTENLIVGRRLLSHELPENIDHVIDLTCEFNEPKALRERSYHSFPILDGFTPHAETLREWIEQAAALPGVVYVHCAEGHGRTGLFAAALLLRQEMFSEADEVIEFLQSKRPLIRLGKRQREALDAIASMG